MAAAWAVIIRTGSSGCADTFWSLLHRHRGVAAALVPLGPGEPTTRAWLVAALVGVWSLRLGTHIMRRTLKGGDDPRYAQLKQEWGDRYRSRSSSLFLEIQAAAAFVLVAARCSSPRTIRGRWGLAIALGVAIAIVAIAGEASARRAAHGVQGRSGEQGQGLRRRALVAVAPPELLLRVAPLARLCADRHQLCAATPGASSRSRRPLMMYWLLRSRLGRAAARGAYAALARRRVPRLSAAGQAFWPIPKRA